MNEPNEDKQIVIENPIQEIRDQANQILGYCNHTPITPIENNAKRIIELLKTIEEWERIRKLNKSLIASFGSTTTKDTDYSDWGGVSERVLPK